MGAPSYCSQPNDRGCQAGRTQSEVPRAVTQSIFETHQEATRPLCFGAKGDQEVWLGAGIFRPIASHFFGGRTLSQTRWSEAGRIRARLGVLAVGSHLRPAGDCRALPDQSARFDDSEPVRNAKAAGALTKSDAKLAPFYFSESCRFDIRRTATIQTSEADCLVVSPGYRAGDYFKGLGAARWISQLRELESASPLRFLFTGAKSEAAANAEIMAGLQCRERHVDLTGQLDRLSDLLAVLEGAQGYVGKDSGTMHLAAALAKPVVAVFGGGHGRRFLPVGTKGVILTVAVPCRGCDWRCHLKDPVCVTDLWDGAVAHGWLALPDLEEGDVRFIEHTPSADTKRLLELSPGTGFPALMHSQRQEALKKARQQGCASVASRIWTRLSSTLKQ